MEKKIVMMLVFAVIITGMVFAQSDFAKNTITVDFGPTIIGAAIGGVGDMIGEAGVSSSGFGIAAQYERQIFQQLSVGGRFAYLGGGIGMGFEDEDQGVKLKSTLEMNIASFSLEGHVRYYPFSGKFFLDGMLGYANMSVTFSGEAIVTEPTTGLKEKEKVSVTASRDYFKLGAKIGWRVDFGGNGGFTFEPSFGYYGGAGAGDTLGKQIASSVKGDMENTGDFDDMFEILENFIFIGGPRLALAFGWRF